MRKMFPSMALSLVTGALLTACGGGTTTPAMNDPSLQVSGTAATGAALANASVSVKCASGNGTATTDANGAYTLKLAGGALPCVIKVTGTQDGVEVTLHSLTEAGSTDSASAVTSASANATPLTEMIVAELTAGLPEDFFSAFNASSGAQISTEKLVAATQAVLTALKDATGIDLGDIDPFKTKLVAATTSAPDGGNTYDKLLDRLGEKVSLEALPQIVAQVATAAASGASGGLDDAMASVQNGSLAGCPAAVSGKYRTLDYFGRTNVRDVNFKTMKFYTEDGQPLFDISANSSKPCEFSVAGADLNGNDVRFDFAMSATGVGTYRVQNFTTARSSVGYLFPVQSHPASALKGEWTYLQSGYSGANASFVHWVGKFDIKADNSIVACDYVAGDYSSCVPNSATRAITARADGGFDLAKNGTTVASLYGYRAPGGTLNVFATQNPTGANEADTMQTSMLLTQLKSLSMPAVGAVSSYWDAQFSQNGPSTTRITSLSADSNTVTAIDGDAATRTRTSDGRVDVVRYNQPATGIRFRAAGATFTAVNQFPIPGAGFTVSINSQPAGPTQAQVYVISLDRK